MNALRAYRDASSDVKLPGKAGVLPAGGGTRIENMPPERKAEYAAHKAKMAGDAARFTEMERQRNADLKGYESNGYYAPYVKGMSREQALQHIESISELIQSGQDEKYSLSTSLDGQRTTSNFRQYLYWMQQHVKGLEGAGQSTLAQA
jgi:hypothetical protein